MNSYKKLLGNSAILAIGNLGSKLISIILVPLYTYYLTTSEYGTVDIITTTSSLVMPIVTLSIFDAVLRFVMGKNYPEDSVISNGLLITIMGSLIIFLLYPILKYFNVLDSSLEYLMTIIILQAFQSVFSEFVRALGKIRIYAYNGLLTTLVNGFMNIVLLVNLNWGIRGYLVSIIISNIFSILYLFFVAKIYKFINIKKVNKKLLKYMLIYSIPLIPNSFMWWVTNTSNRYFIRFFAGADENGLFAVANKIPSLLSILNSIFFQAWQVSAIEEYQSNDKANFYSVVFKYFSIVMFLGASVIILLLKIVVSFAVSPDYYESWKYVPFLLLGVIFSSFSSFLGTNYIAAQQTKGIFSSTVYGGIISVTANLLLMPIIGTYAAGISTIFSFFVIFMLRLKGSKQFVNLKIDVKHFIINILILFAQIIVLFLNLNRLVELSIESIIFILLLFIDRDVFKPIKKMIEIKYKK